MISEKREISIKRAEKLRGKIEDYLLIRDSIPKGLEEGERIEANKKRILSILKGTEEDWKDYNWQLKNRIMDAKTLSRLIALSPKEIKAIGEVEKKFRWAISPYYLSLVNADDKLDPIKLMAIPTHLEISNSEGLTDPMAEEYTNPAGSITRRYPDRLIINVTNSCAMYCRHCQRRRHIGQKDEEKSKDLIMESINYIRENHEIRDVLVTGGDPLTLSDEALDWLLGELRSIPHLEYIRLGSRIPVTMPQRITDNLCNILKKYHPIYLNTHFNHPMEITKESKEACERLANSGIPLGNQTVLLNGINNDKFVMRCLNHELLKCRVKPYYIFHAKHVKGTLHFNTSIDDGIEIMEYLRGYTSGMAIPTYIVNAPDGYGKTPILPEYLISRGRDYVMLRTWEGKVFKYENHPTVELEDLI